MSPDLLQKYSIGNFHFPVKSAIDSILVSKDSILEVVQKVKEAEQLLYEQLVDITATDNMLSKSSSSNERFTIIYSFLSLKNNKRLFVFTNLSENDLDIDSILRYLSQRIGMRESAMICLALTLKITPIFNV